MNEVLQEIGIDACCLGSLDWCKNVWKKPWESPDSVAFDVPIFSGNMVVLQSVDTWNEGR